MVTYASIRAHQRGDQPCRDAMRSNFNLDALNSPRPNASLVRDLQHRFVAARKRRANSFDFVESSFCTVDSGANGLLDHVAFEFWRADFAYATHIKAGNLNRARGAFQRILDTPVRCETIPLS
jgi:hypothetical protein